MLAVRKTMSGLSNQLVFLARLIEQLDHAAEAAGRQAGESIDGPVRCAVRPSVRGARARRCASAELLVARGEAVDALLQVSLDRVRRCALLDRDRWRAERGGILGKHGGHRDSSSAWGN